MITPINYNEIDNVANKKPDFGSNFNIVLTGGGTAGHIYPALACAEELKDRGHNVFFAGTPGGIEAKLVPAAHISFKPFEASGFNRKHPSTLIKGTAKILKSESAAKKWLQKVDANAVVGFGGYVSLPVAMAAESLGIPVVIHEQNSYMGMANKRLSHKAAATCLTYMCAAEGTGAANTILTGNPVRRDVLQTSRASGRAQFNIPQDATLMLVFGGSLGARHINQAICAMKEDLFSHENLHIIHVTGPREQERVEEVLAFTPEQKTRYHVFGYLDNMPAALSAADFVVSRSGATSLAEISALKIPAVLVPYPHATADHQTLNAKEYVSAGCAYAVPDAEVDGDKFRECVLELIECADVRVRMSECANKLKTYDAAKNLADVIENVIGK